MNLTHSFENEKLKSKVEIVDLQKRLRGNNVRIIPFLEEWEKGKSEALYLKIIVRNLQLP